MKTENKKVWRITVFANDESDYPGRNVKNGYKIIYEDYSSKFVELETKIDENGYVTFVDFKDQEVLLKYKNKANRNMQLMFFKDKIVELQEKYCCPECDGWLEHSVPQHEVGDYTCVKCKESFNIG